MLSGGKSVVIAIRDTELSSENPYTTAERWNMIQRALKQYGELVKIIVIPDIDEIRYGRNVGYRIREIRLSAEKQKISGTEIRASTLKRHSIYWITGQSGSGKTTLAHALQKEIRKVVLDGDEIFMENKFYITTPIYYINDIPALGHSYTTVAADVLAQWHRFQGDDVFFLTGLDENSQKTIEAAKAQKIKDIQKYTDIMAEKWKKVWKILNISYDGFIRTTEKRHKDLVKRFFMDVYKKKDIYKGHYKGLYCGGCEAYLTESDLVDGLCPYHKKRPEYISEKNYFFRLSKYQNKILKHLKKNSDFIQPTSRRNEVIGFVKKGLQDISISRQNSKWGIPLPINEKHRLWCWFDALLNYISGTKEEYWPATVHLIGKDILRFHAVIWPAMLLSAGYELPKTIFAHGFFTINGQKMSKSLGNVIDPNKLVEKYGVDAVRYLLLSQFPFGVDGDIKEDLFLEKYNTDLANGIGNLFERVFSLINKFSKESMNDVKTIDRKLENFLTKIENQYKQHIEAYDLFKASKDLLLFIKGLDRYINDKEPWVLYKKNSSKLNIVLNSLFFGVKKLNVLIQPFMPNKANQVESFIKKISNLQSRKKIGKLNLFPRINKNS